MKEHIVLQIAAIVILGFAFVLVVKSHHTWAQPQLRQSVERKFEEYRKTIKDSHQVDIKNFKEKLRGGMADGKAITDYDLGQLLEGIKWEREHTSDSLLALEIAMDHLERIPDYHTHLVRMERQCDSEKFLNM
jgi:ribosome-associated translation inhibitor RaiA